jgi:WD40 repeat protein
MWATAQGPNVYIWEAGTGRVLRKIAGDRYEVRHVAFLEHGQRLFFAGADAVHLVDTSTWQEVERFDSARRRVGAYAYDPGRNLLVMAGSANLEIVNASNFEPLKTANRWEYVRGMAISRDARLLATVDKEVRILDAATLVEKLKIPGERSGLGNGLAFTPDGRYLAVGSEGPASRLQIYDVDAGTRIHDVEAHEGWMRGLAISPDGSLIATSGKLSEVKLWDAKTCTLQRKMSLVRKLVPVSSEP